MKKLFSGSTRIIKGAVALVLAFVMVAGSIFPMVKAKAVSVSINNTATVYEWNRETNLSNYTPGVLYPVLLIWDYYNMCYCTSGGYWTDKEDFDLYTDDYDADVYCATTLAREAWASGYNLIGNQTTTAVNRFYTQGNLNAWTVERKNWSHSNLGHFRMSDGWRVTVNDDGGSCFQRGGGYDEEGDDAWTLSSNSDGTISIYYDVSGAFDANDYVGSNGRYMFCESISSRPSMTHYIMYIGHPVVWSCIAGDMVVEAGTVLNIADGVFLKDGVTLTIEPGAVVSVEKQFWNNGTIKNYGTLILRSGAQMNSFDVASWNSKACTIQCYGSQYSCATKLNGTQKGEGNLIVLSDAVLSLNDKSGPLELKGGATMNNFGTVILPTGYSISNSTLNNYGRIGIGWYFQTKGQNMTQASYTEDASKYMCYGNGSFYRSYSTVDLSIEGTDKSKLTNSGTIGFRSDISAELKSKLQSQISK